MDINTFLFTRTAPKKKLETLQALDSLEFLSVTYDTILRIVKEAGSGDSRKARNKFKTLFLETGNGWDSTIDSVYNWKKDELFFDIYIQGDSTDTSVEYKVRDFLSNRFSNQIVGYIEEGHRDGSYHKTPARYDKVDSSRVLKSICITYVKTKYKDKL